MWCDLKKLSLVSISRTFPQPDVVWLGDIARLGLLGALSLPQRKGRHSVGERVTCSLRPKSFTFYWLCCSNKLGHRLPIALRSRPFPIAISRFSNFKTTLKCVPINIHRYPHFIHRKIQHTFFNLTRLEIIIFGNAYIYCLGIIHLMSVIGVPWIVLCGGQKDPVSIHRGDVMSRMERDRGLFRKRRAILHHVAILVKGGRWLPDKPLHVDRSW